MSYRRYPTIIPAAGSLDVGGPFDWFLLLTVGSRGGQLNGQFFDGRLAASGPACQLDPGVVIRGQFGKVTLINPSATLPLTVEFLVGWGDIQPSRLIAQLGDLVVTSRRNAASGVVRQDGAGTPDLFTIGQNTNGAIIRSIYAHAVAAAGVRGECHLMKEAAGPIETDPFEFEIQSGTADTVTVDRYSVDIFVPAGLGVKLKVIGADSTMSVAFTLLTASTSSDGNAP